MKWGLSWGKYWGLIDPYELARQKVVVRYMKGKLLPCKNCKWYYKCVVPKSLKRPTRYYGKPSMRKVYRCEDYTPKYVKMAEQT